MSILKKLIMSFLTILLGSVAIQTTLTQDTKSEISYPKIFTNAQIRKHINPAVITPALIDQKNNEILTLKNQLSSSFEKNPELQKLHKEKKEVKQRITGLISFIQKKQSQNKQILQQYQDAKTKKDFPLAPLQMKVNALMQEVKNTQLQLTQYFTKLHELKGALKRADPSRQNLLKKLHSANQELIQMRLTQHIKTIPDRPKK